MSIGVDHDIEVKEKGTFSKLPKKYNWDGHGTIKLIPWYWKGVLGVPIPVGSWEPAPNDDFHKELTDMSAGSWTVKRNWKTLPPPKNIQVPDDDGGSTGVHNIVLTPSDSSSMITAGSSYTMNLSVPSGYTSIHWYIKGPSDAGYGTTAATQTGSGSISTSASYTYSIPSDASGEYVLTAYIYLADNTIAEPSYTVSVSNSGTSPSSSTSPSESSTWLYCVKCGELYMPIYNDEWSCLEGGSHQDSY